MSKVRTRSQSQNRDKDLRDLTQDGKGSQLLSAGVAAARVHSTPLRSENGKKGNNAKKVTPKKQRGSSGGGGGDDGDDEDDEEGHGEEEEDEEDEEVYDDSLSISSFGGTTDPFARRLKEAKRRMRLLHGREPTPEEIRQEIKNILEEELATQGSSVMTSKMEVRSAKKDEEKVEPHVEMTNWIDGDLTEEWWLQPFKNIAPAKLAADLLEEHRSEAEVRRRLPKRCDEAFVKFIEVTYRDLLDPKKETKTCNHHYLHIKLLRENLEYLTKDYRHSKEWTKKAMGWALTVGGVMLAIKYKGPARIGVPLMIDTYRYCHPGNIVPGKTNYGKEALGENLNWAYVRADEAWGKLADRRNNITYDDLQAGRPLRSSSSRKGKTFQKRARLDDDDTDDDDDEERPRYKGPFNRRKDAPKNGKGGASA